MHLKTIKTVSRGCLIQFTEKFISKMYGLVLRYDLGLETFNSSTLADYRIKSPSEKYFLLCPRCFWCVSCLNIGGSNIGECPCCYNVRLDSIPVSYNELCKFDYDPKRGITLEFSKSAEAEGSKKQKSMDIL
jgi:hypothetical protein